MHGADGLADRLANGEHAFAGSVGVEYGQSRDRIQEQTFNGRLETSMQLRVDVGEDEANVKVSIMPLMLSNKIVLPAVQRLKAMAITAIAGCRPMSVLPAIRAVHSARADSPAHVYRPFLADVYSTPYIDAQVRDAWGGIFGHSWTFLRDRYKDMLITQAGMEPPENVGGEIEADVQARYIAAGGPWAAELQQMIANFYAAKLPTHGHPLASANSIEPPQFAMKWQGQGDAIGQGAVIAVDGARLIGGVADCHLRGCRIAGGAAGGEFGG